MPSSQPWSQVPGCLANAVNFPRSHCQSSRRTHGTWGRAQELDPSLCPDLTLLPNAWKKGLLEEEDTQTSRHAPDSHKPARCRHRLVGLDGTVGYYS